MTEKRKQLIAQVLVFTVCFLVILSTMPQNFHWGADQEVGVLGGELLASIKSSSAPISGGFPTYLVLAKLVSFIPAGTLAFKLNFLSVLLTALTAVFIFRISHKLYQNLAVAAGISLLIPFSRIFWRYAEVTSIEPLEALLAAVVINLLISIKRGKSKELNTNLLIISSLLFVFTHFRNILVILPLTLLSDVELEKTNISGKILSAIIGLSPLLYFAFLLKTSNGEAFLLNNSLLTYFLGERFRWQFLQQNIRVVIDSFYQGLFAFSQAISYPALVLVGVGAYERLTRKTDKIAAGIVFSLGLTFIYKAAYTPPNSTSGMLPALVMTSYLVTFGAKTVIKYFKVLVKSRPILEEILVFQQELKNQPAIRINLASSLVFLLFTSLLALPLYQIKTNYMELNLRQDYKNTGLRYANLFKSALQQEIEKNPGKKLIVVPGDEKAQFTLKWLFSERPKIGERVVFVEGNYLYGTPHLKKTFKKLYPELIFPDRPTGWGETAFNSLADFFRANLEGGKAVYYTFDYPYPTFFSSVRKESPGLTFTSIGPIFKVELSQYFNDSETGSE